MSSVNVQHQVRIAHYAGMVEASRLLGSRMQERRLKYRIPSAVFNCGPARVRVRTLQNGIFSVVYSGVIGAMSFASLRQNVILATLEARGLLIDMTAVLSTCVLVPPIPTSLYPSNSAPGVVVCRVDQLTTWQQYASDIAGHGIMRIVFLDSERALAQSVARSLAGV